MTTAFEKLIPSALASGLFSQVKSDNGGFSEAMSLNSWNGLAEHRLLGGIFRARKALERKISRLRHGFNKQKRAEPAAN